MGPQSASGNESTREARGPVEQSRFADNPWEYGSGGAQLSATCMFAVFITPIPPRVCQQALVL